MGVRSMWLIMVRKVLKMAAKQNYDLILMDLQMPVMDGYQATKLIRQRDQQIPIVALSAAVLPEERARVKQAGMNEHLAKPIDVPALQQVLARYLIIEEAKAAPKTEASEVLHAAHFVYLKVDQLITLFGTEALVRSLLATFAAHYEQADSLFNEQLSVDQLRRELHALKGAAGNLFLVSLQQMAQVLHKTSDEGVLRAGLANLKQEISDCVIEIRRYEQG
ncbi:MAG: hypothetical protein B7Y29_03155 [Thiotrichales bacterium 16-46-22]|nr:MAG: hypothetical protein B7Y29_03155 [Thiotrichales bacterium 16-46-22]